MKPLQCNWRYHRSSESRALRGYPIASVGYTLVELITVIAIFTLISALVLPSIYVVRSARFSTEVTQLGSFFDTARAFSMKRQTYTWVGFSVLPSGQTVVAAVSSIDSTSNLTQSNLLFETKPIILSVSSVIPNLTLPAAYSANVVDVTTSSLSFQAAFGGQNLTFTNVIQCSPRGEAAMSSTTIPAWIQIGLVPINNPSNSSQNRAILQVAGVSGQLFLYRP